MFPEIYFLVATSKTAIPNFIIIAVESERTGCGSISGCYASDAPFVSSSSDEMRREAGIVVCTLLHAENHIGASFDDAAFVERCFFVFDRFCFI